MKSNDFFVDESHGLRQELSGSMHRRSANLSSEGLVKFNYKSMVWFDLVKELMTHIFVKSESNLKNKM